MGTVRTVAIFQSLVDNSKEVQTFIFATRISEPTFYLKVDSLESSG